MAEVVIEIRQARVAQALYAQLGVERFSVPSHLVEPRLVIDFRFANSPPLTFLAGDGMLWLENGRSGRPIDAAFKALFACGAW
jgi:hypothetical protein